jgi:branched-chain amino acid transport system substrate-binding protein
MATAEEPDQGRTLVFSDRGLRLRPRSLQGFSRFLEQNGGIIVNNDFVPTNTADYSAYILKIRQLKPDFVYLNLAGVDQTTFLKQYKEYGLPISLPAGDGHGAVWATGLMRCPATGRACGTTA